MTSFIGRGLNKPDMNSASGLYLLDDIETPADQ